jgi:hypothetical protein
MTVSSLKRPLSPYPPRLIPPKWKLKGCPRCGGDCFLDDLIQPPTYTCLQCGYPESTITALPYVRRESPNGYKR